MNNVILPNSFQAPNSHVDIAMQYLTGDEYKVLSFGTRHILGWTDRIASRSGAISLSTFEHGWSNMGGCGLSRPTIIQCLKTLDSFGLLVKVVKFDNLGQPIKPGPEGQEYSIGTSPNWSMMQARVQKKAEANRKRTSNARSSKGGKSDNTSKSDNTGDVPLTTGGKSDNTSGGLSDNTHTKPILKPLSKPKKKKALPAGAGDENSPADLGSNDGAESNPKKALTAYQLWFGAITREWIKDKDKITEAKKKQVGKIAREMIKAEIDPKWGFPIALYVKQVFDNPTMHAMPKNAKEGIEWYKLNFGMPPEYDPDWKPKDKPKIEDEPPRVADGINYKDYSDELNTLIDQAAEQMKENLPKKKVSA